MAATFFSRSVVAATSPLLLLLLIVITFVNGDGSMHHHPGHEDAALLSQHGDSAAVGAGAARNIFRSVQAGNDVPAPPSPSLVEMESGKVRQQGASKN